jgi:hypothetical protein
MSPTSLVPVAKQDALRAAEVMLKDVDKRRAAERTKTIHGVLDTRRVRTGWFKTRPITPDEAERLVDQPHDIFDDDWRLGLWRLEYEGNKTLAERLQAAVQLTCDGTIWLNLEEAAVVQSFL